MEPLRTFFGEYKCIRMGLNGKNAFSEIFCVTPKKLWWPISHFPDMALRLFKFNVWSSSLLTTSSWPWVASEVSWMEKGASPQGSIHHQMVSES